MTLPMRKISVDVYHAVVVHSLTRFSEGSARFCFQNQFPSEYQCVK